MFFANQMAKPGVSKKLLWQMQNAKKYHEEQLRSLDAQITKMMRGIELNILYPSDNEVDYSDPFLQGHAGIEKKN